MKRKVIPELISAVTIGTLFGFFANGTHEKWHRLGREALLAWESQYFDKHYATPEPTIRVIITWVLIALIVFTLYKVFAFMAAKILSAFSGKSDAAQG